MFCSNCGIRMEDDSRFCPSCGQPVNGTTSANASAGPSAYQNSNSGRNVFSDIASQVTKVAGIDTASDLKLSEVFSNVFKKHSEEDAENLFIAGTSKTTPDILSASDTWPKPWLFVRVFFIALFSYFVLQIGFDKFNNINFLPGLIVMGSFAVPISLLIFFWEMNTPQNISLYTLIKIMFMGGVLSLIITMILDSALSSDTATKAIVIGIVEETAKVLPILWYMRDKKFKYVLNGLLIGAAIGAGFAAFESAGYALRVGLQAGQEDMYKVMFLRGLLAPGGHIVWAGLSGAALALVKRDKPFTFDMVTDFRFFRVFAIVVVLHALWDMPFTPAIADIPIHTIILTVVSWIITFAMISAGLKEISSFKHQSFTSSNNEIPM